MTFAFINALSIAVLISNHYFHHLYAPDKSIHTHTRLKRRAAKTLCKKKSCLLNQNIIYIRTIFFNHFFITARFDALRRLQKYVNLKVFEVAQSKCR